MRLTPTKMAIARITIAAADLEPAGRAVAADTEVADQATVAVKVEMAEVGQAVVAARAATAQVVAGQVVAADTAVADLAAVVVKVEMVVGREVMDQAAADLAVADTAVDRAVVVVPAMAVDPEAAVGTVVDQAAVAVKVAMAAGQAMAADRRPHPLSALPYLAMQPLHLS